MIHIRGRLQGVHATQDALARMSGLLMEQMAQDMRAALFHTTAIAQKRYLSGPRPQHLGVITGRLRSSLSEGASELVFDISRLQGQVRGTIGTNVLYAAVHEYGGVIRPRRATHLFIPGRAIRTATGAVQSAYNRPLRQIPQTFVRPNPRGGWLVFQRISSTSIKLLGVLKSSVRIPARPFLNPALHDATPWILQRFGQGAARVEQRITALLRR